MKTPRIGSRLTERGPCAAGFVQGPFPVAYSAQSCAHQWVLPAAVLHVISLCLLSLCLAACTDDAATREQPIDVPDGCNPLAFEHDCLLPFPSDVFLVDDPATISGERLVISDAAAVRGDDGGVVDPLSLHPADGFSPGSQILALFPGGVDEGPLVGATDDPLFSLGDDSPTLLLDAQSGERVLHLAETDPRADDDARRALVIRPLVRLTEGRRYVVAIRGLRDRDGKLVPTPKGFAHLRDGGTSIPIAARYETDVFAPLEAAGVTRDELQLAWDFTVRSRDDAVGDMLRVRELTMAYLADAAPALKVIEFEDQPDPSTARRIELTVDVPLFLEEPGPGALLFRDATGKVAQNGVVEVPFTVWVPNSVANRPPGSPSARLLQFGHGFFGGRGEVDGFIVQLADERELVVVAGDWWGMSEEDRVPVSDQLVADLGQGLRFTDRLHQAMANFIVIADVARGSLGSLTELETLEVDAAPLFDSDPLYFYGISLGGILGGTYLGLTPHIERGVLGVGAANFSFMLFRARPFVLFLLLIAATTNDFLDHQKFAMLAQTTFDRVDPLTYAPFVIDEPLPGGPSTRQVLMQIGMGDDQVPNLAAHLHARALGVTHLTPAPREIAGLPSDGGPVANAIVEYDFGVDPLPGAVAKPPTTENEAHEGVRRSEAAKEQLHRFFQASGMVEHTCDGPCDPE
jgi:hypothetical protein